MPWDQTQNYVRSGHNNPEDFDPETLKTTTLSEEEGIKAVTGKPWNRQSTEIITYLFSIEKGWTKEKAQQARKKGKRIVQLDRNNTQYSTDREPDPRKSTSPDKDCSSSRVATDKRIPKRRARKICPHLSWDTPNSRPQHSNRRQSPRSRI